MRSAEVGVPQNHRHDAVVATFLSLACVLHCIRHMKAITIALATVLAACTAESAPARTTTDQDASASPGTMSDAGTESPALDADVELPYEDSDGGVGAEGPGEPEGPGSCTPRTCEDLMYECGSPDDGCGNPLYCGDCEDAIACNEGQCVCPADNYETSTEALRGTLVDVDDSVVMTQGRISGSSDVDEYAFEVIDSGFGGNPIVTITMTQGMAGVKISEARYLCASGGDENAVNLTDTTVEIATECAGSEEDGTLLVTLTKNDRTTEDCIPYEFSVTASE